MGWWMVPGWAEGGRLCQGQVWARALSMMRSWVLPEVEAVGMLSILAPVHSFQDANGS